MNCWRLATRSACFAYRNNIVMEDNDHNDIGIFDPKTRSVKGTSKNCHSWQSRTSWGETAQNRNENKAKSFAGKLGAPDDRWQLFEVPLSLSPPSMDNKPIALSREEMKEIAAIEDIRQMWGAEDVTEMEDTRIFFGTFTRF